MVDNPQSINLIRFDMESHFVFTPLYCSENVRILFGIMT